MNLAARIYRLIQSYTKDEISEFQKKIFDQGSSLEDELNSFEQAQGQKTAGSSSSQAPPRDEPKPEAKRTSPYPQELIDDLAVLGLKPPATFAEVKKARNKEIKSFHPDKFSSDKVKEEAAKQILQLINGAYERLEKRLS